MLKLDQDRLNITERSRTSRLPWRGQFSPEFIEYIIEAVCPDSRSFLDPFCGSGTVLYEAAARGFNAFGCEVNPAAWHLAWPSSYPSLASEEKVAINRRLRAFASDVNREAKDLLSSGTQPTILDEIHDSGGSPFLARSLAAAVLIGMGQRRDLTGESIARGAFTILGLMNEISSYQGRVDCYIADARQTLLERDSVEAVITSPPYINVFNYHQNYRPSVELLGWKPLEAARSEIGSNRKHRMNRFLTVVQYCIDMAQALAEMSRVLKVGAPLVIVLGRTSNVLGAAFRNGELIARIIEASGGYSDVQRAERVFTNRFGDRIFEDVLISRKVRQAYCDVSEARRIGKAALCQARESVPDKNRSDLEAAIARTPEVRASTLLEIGVPAPFGDAFIEARKDGSHSRIYAR